MVREPVPSVIPNPAMARSLPRREGIASPAPVADLSLLAMDMREFKLFRTLVHERTGIWLRDGKQVMLASRLSRRLRHHGLSNFADYYDYVRNMPENSEEILELINCVTTNKTSFFREPHHFKFLAETVVPQIQEEARQGGPRSIRIWCAASSTGEEPYSIALTLLEALRSNLNTWRIEVVASDIDTAVLGTATRAIYPAESLETVDPSLQKKYFLRGKDDMSGHVKVKPEMRKLVEFKRINLMDARWPLDGLFDVIFFRNALIYFNQDTQDIFLRKMARYLKRGGYLFLGNSEHIPWLQDIFAPLKQTMYRLKDTEK